MNKYQNSLKKLYTLNRQQFFKYDLSNVEKLAALFGNPQNYFQAVHVTGTNGKGSVTYKIANVLKDNGFKTGAFMSPHVTTFRERIKVNDQYISQEYIVEWLETCFKIINRNKLQNSFFEILTVLAFSYFKDQQIDIGCVEVGIGGRLDCTNILNKKLLSIITSIDFDHQEILGNSLKEILIEKCGIIKRDMSVLIGPNLPHKNIVEEICEKLNSQLYETFMDENEKNFKKINKEISRNAIGILSSELLKNLKINEDVIEKNLPCRMELVNKQLQSKKQIPQDVDIYMDVGHNVQGLQQIFQQQNFSKKPVVIFGTSKLKLFPEILNVLKQKSYQIYLIESKGPKKVSVQILEEISKENKIDVKIMHNGDIKKTLQEIFENKKLFNQPVLICGTFFIMEEVRDYFEYKDPKDNVFLNEIRKFQQCLIYQIITRMTNKFVKMNMMI